MNDLRAMQAERLYNRGLGEGHGTFDQYLRGIPAIPGHLVEDDRELPYLSLVDPLLGLARCCEFVNVEYGELGYSDDSVEPFDEAFSPPTKPFWFRHDGGQANWNRRPVDCRDERRGDVMAGSAVEGVFAFFHHPHIINGGMYVLDLPMTNRRGVRGACAHLGAWRGRAQLRLGRRLEHPFPHNGSMRVRR